MHFQKVRTRLVYPTRTLGVERNPSMHRTGRHARRTHRTCTYQDPLIRRRKPQFERPGLGERWRVGDHTGPWPGHRQALVMSIRPCLTVGTRTGSIIQYMNVMSKTPLSSSLSCWKSTICCGRIVTVTFHQIGAQIMSYPLFFLNNFLNFSSTEWLLSLLGSPSTMWNSFSCSCSQI